jgi:hypothetical protein
VRLDAAGAESLAHYAGGMWCSHAWHASVVVPGAPNVARIDALLFSRVRRPVCVEKTGTCYDAQRKKALGFR